MKKLICALLCAAMLPTLTGCFSRSEPKTLAIVESAIYDLTEDGQYRVTLEIMNPAAAGGAGGGGDSSPNITVTGVAASAPEALREVSFQLEKTVFGGHNRVRIFTERFARHDMFSIMDFYSRDHLTDETSLIVVFKGDGDPRQIHSSKIGLSDMVGDYIDGLSKSQPGVVSKSVFVTTLDFLKDYYSDGKQPVSGLIELVECEDKPSKNMDLSTAGEGETGSGAQYKLQYSGLAAFKGSQLVGYMDENETEAYNLLTNNVKSAFVSIPSGNDYTVARIYKSKSDAKISYQGEQIGIEITLNITLEIIQEGGTLDITRIEPLKQVEERFNQQIQAKVVAAIQRAQQEFQSDIFGFGNGMHAAHPKKWKEIKGNWDDYFSRAFINVTVKSSVARSGELKEPLGMEELE